MFAGLRDIKRRKAFQKKISIEKKVSGKKRSDTFCPFTTGEKRGQTAFFAGEKFVTGRHAKR